uniref:Uncharacterized protein n=1 Tax=Psilocybe cubensis TaxID=181762 RepID=A0A8H7Y9E9_PSICU
MESGRINGGGKKKIIKVEDDANRNHGELSQRGRGPNFMIAFYKDFCISTMRLEPEDPQKPMEDINPPSLSGINEMEDGDAGNTQLRTFKELCATASKECIVEIDLLAQLTLCMSALRIQERELSRDIHLDTTKMRNVISVAQNLLDEAVGNSCGPLFDGIPFSKQRCTHAEKRTRERTVQGQDGGSENPLEYVTDARTSARKRQRPS